MQNKVHEIQHKNIKLLPQQFMVINKHWEKNNPRLIGTNILIYSNQKIEIRPCDNFCHNGQWKVPEPETQNKTVGLMIVY